MNFLSNLLTNLKVDSNLEVYSKLNISVIITVVTYFMNVFFQFIQAMRRYLLLGQGDFIRHLMDLLE